MKLGTTVRRLRRILALAAACALTAGGVAVAPSAATAASPAFDSLELYSGGGAFLAVEYPEASCTGGPETATPSSAIPFEENDARTARSSASVALRLENGSDTLVASTWTRGTARAATEKGLPKKLSLDFRGAVTAAGPGKVGACGLGVGSSLSLSATLAVSRPLWTTITSTASANARVESRISDTADLWYDSRWTRGSSSKTILLAPGSYTLYLHGGSMLAPIDADLGEATAGTVQIAFSPTGSAVGKPSGTALRYASLGAARSCSTHGLSAAVTTSTSRFKRIEKITWKVNGKTVKTLKGRSLKRGKRVVLRLGDRKPASVKVAVELRKGKTSTAAARYLACR
ncbi:hypothetical protein J4H92_13860 [Leucobacter weissii]|uniref:Uncharacterized protein n=1 Tax=Leucobacter weissii TaxID=1983706 RepID=A0A939SBI7_9MICO|nr:hypothetical protein [Leucobacter weissii]MBO1903027.1 hypothetical protein [Leucobacter weissii]